MAEPLPYLKLENSVIFWFRRDLRLDDNHALYKALDESNSVIPISVSYTHLRAHENEADVV